MLLRDLVASPELNGRIGFVIGFHAPSARFIVKLLEENDTLSDTKMRFKASNLLSADDVDEKFYPSEESETHSCEWQPSPPLSGVLCFNDGLGPSCSMTVGRQT